MFRDYRPRVGFEVATRLRCVVDRRAGGTAARGGGRL